MLFGGGKVQTCTEAVVRCMNFKKNALEGVHIMACEHACTHAIWTYAYAAGIAALVYLCAHH